MTKTITVIFDNNAIISAAILKNSVPAKALDFAIANCLLLQSEKTLEELRQVLKREKFNKYINLQERDDFVNYVMTNVIKVQVTSVITDCRDPKDNKFLELAVDGNAKYIVTGDKDLLVLHPF